MYSILSKNKGGLVNLYHFFFFLVIFDPGAGIKWSETRSLLGDLGDVSPEDYVRCPRMWTKCTRACVLKTQKVNSTTY